MTLLKSTAAYLCFVALFLPPNVTGQNNSEKDSSNLEILIAAKEIMNASNNCALISMDQEGHPRVRMMDPFSPETDFTVYAPNLAAPVGAAFLATLDVLLDLFTTSLIASALPCS